MYLLPALIVNEKAIPGKWQFSHTAHRIIPSCLTTISEFWQNFNPFLDLNPWCMLCYFNFISPGLVSIFEGKHRLKFVYMYLHDWRFFEHYKQHVGKTVRHWHFRLPFLLNGNDINTVDHKSTLKETSQEIYLMEIYKRSWTSGTVILLPTIYNLNLIKL